MDTKQQILDSAQRVISQKGFSSARVSDIVADAGVAQGTFYLYFKCKQDIILEIAKQITFAQNSRIEKFEQVGDYITKEEFIAQIYDIFDSYVHFFEKHAAILRVLATETGNNPSQEPVINAIVSRVHKAFIHFFEVGRKSGFLREFDYSSISQMAIMAVMQFFFSTLTKPSDFPSSEKIREFVDMCLHGIMKD